MMKETKIYICRCQKVKSDFMDATCFSLDIWLFMVKMVIGKQSLNCLFDCLGLSKKNIRKSYTRCPTSNSGCFGLKIILCIVGLVGTLSFVVKSIIVTGVRKSFIYYIK